MISKIQLPSSRFYITSRAPFAVCKVNFLLPPTPTSSDHSQSSEPETAYKSSTYAPHRTTKFGKVRGRVGSGQRETCCRNTQYLSSAYGRRCSDSKILVISRSPVRFRESAPFFSIKIYFRYHPFISH